MPFHSRALPTARPSACACRFGLRLPERLQKLVARPQNTYLQFLLPLHTLTIFPQYTAIYCRHKGFSRCVKLTALFGCSPQPDKIQSHHFGNILPTQSSPSALPSQVDLNFSPATQSFSSGSSSSTIYSQDFPVFTTDSQSPWLPSSSPSLPAQPAQQQFSPPVEQPQQDFVLFDQPAPRPSQPRHHTQQSSASDIQHRRHSSHQLRQHQQRGRQSLIRHNQRLAQIQAADHSRSPSSLVAYRFTSPAHQAQFYAASAPSSSLALQQQSRRHLPPVPLFSQSTGQTSQRSSKMELQELDLDDFTGFEGGASTTYSSPAMPSVFDLGGSASGASNLGTVSPQDLLIQEPFMSAPNSTAFTALTSPSVYNESPDFNDGYDVSPNFGSGDFETGSTDPWFPLFPQETAPPKDTQQNVGQSPAVAEEDLEVVEFTSASARRKPSGSPPSGSGRHSSVAGVNSRKRDKPLPPIVVEDPSDVVAMKRARNTLAARKSRERKAQRFEDLEEKIRKLEAERDHWKNVALGRT